MPSLPSEMGERLRQLNDRSECLASGYLDIESGKLLLLEGGTGQGRRSIELVALAAAELLQRSNAAVRTLWAILERLPDRSSSSSELLREVLIQTESCLHIVLRSRTAPEMALIMVFREEINPGMALSESRRALPELER